MNVSTVLSFKTNSHNGELSRLLSAAVASQRFCKLLLTDPERALKVGYQSESFRLSPEEKMWVLSIRAGNLSDFASEIVKFQSQGQRVHMPAMAVGAVAGRMYSAS
jgi:hypothetical protein